MAPEAPLTKDELVAKAKIAFKTNVANARIAATTPNSRDIDLSKLFPDWDKNTVIQNARRDNILGVVLKQTDREYWEIDFLFVNNKPAQLIKRFTRKDRCLTLYDGLGRFIQKGVYDADSKTMQLFLTRSQLSSRARISADSTGGESTNRTVCVPTVIYKRKIEGNSNTGSSQSQNPEQNQNSNETWQNGECDDDGGESGETGGEQGGGESYGEGGGYQVGKEPGEGGIEMGDLYASANESEVPVGPVYDGSGIENVYTGGNQGAGGSTSSGGGTTSSGTSSAIGDIKKDKVTKSCLSSTIDRVTEPTRMTNLTQKIQDAFGVSGNGEAFDLNFIEQEHVYSPTTGKEVAASTSRLQNGNQKLYVDIYLNSSRLPGTDQEFIDMTILHECVHAYFEYLTTQSSPSTPSHVRMADSPYFQILFDAIRDLTGIKDTTILAALSLYGLGDASESGAYKARMSQYGLKAEDILRIGEQYENVEYDSNNNLIKVGGSNCQ